MKILLLNDGGYYALEGVKFPVEAEASLGECGLAFVSDKEIQRVGACGAIEGDDYPFFYGGEFTIINE